MFPHRTSSLVTRQINHRHIRQWSFFAKESTPAAANTESEPASQSTAKKSLREEDKDLNQDTGNILQHKSDKQKQRKTMAQMDEEMRLAMEGRAGDGGESGVELEDGKPTAMKRGVRDNMFRYI